MGSLCRHPSTRESSGVKRAPSGPSWSDSDERTSSELCLVACNGQGRPGDGAKLQPMLSAAERTTIGTTAPMGVARQTLEKVAY